MARFHSENNFSSLGVEKKEDFGPPSKGLQRGTKHEAIFRLKIKKSMSVADENEIQNNLTTAKGI